MGIFHSTKEYRATTEQMGTVMRAVCDTLKAEGYEVDSQALSSGGIDISITKGNTFQAVIGMRSALKIKVVQSAQGSYTADASVGIFGQQAVPSAIMLFIAWPIIIPQIWGMIQQSKLDDHVLDLIQKELDRSDTPSGEEAVFCTHCGHKLKSGDRFCSGCGERQ